MGETPNYTKAAAASTPGRVRACPDRRRFRMPSRCPFSAPRRLPLLLLPSALGSCGVRDAKNLFHPGDYWVKYAEQIEEESYEADNPCHGPANGKQSREESTYGGCGPCDSRAKRGEHDPCRPQAFQRLLRLRGLC